MSQDPPTYILYLCSPERIWLVGDNLSGYYVQLSKYSPALQ
jgi:hypothetical protein